MRISNIALSGLALFIVTPHADGQTFLDRSAQEWISDCGSSSPLARRNAAFALGNMGSQATSAVPVLTRNLEKEGDVGVRETIVIAIGEIAHGNPRFADDSDLVALLATILRQDAQVPVRRGAALALGKIGRGARPAQRALETALDDAAPEVRQNAAWALGRLDLNDLGGLPKALRDTDVLVKRDAAAALELFEPETIRPIAGELAALCQEPDTELRRAVLAALIRVVGPDDGKLAKFVTPALSDRDSEVRRNAALTLANIGGKEAAEALPVLLDALKRADNDLRRQAAAAIRNLGSFAAPAVPELIAALSDPDGELRGNVALALGGIGKDSTPAVPALVAMLARNDERTENRIEAAVALSRIGSSRAAVAAVPTLLAILTDPTQDAKVRERIVWALRVHSGELRNLKGVTDSLQRVVSETPGPQNRMLRFDCAYMSGMIQGPEVSPRTLDVLLEFLKDDKVQIYVSKQISVSGANIEAMSGKASVREVGKGDGRVMAVQALAEIGASRVKARPDIVQQLQVFANDPTAYDALRTAARELVATLK